MADLKQYGDTEFDLTDADETPGRQTLDGVSDTTDRNCLYGDAGDSLFDNATGG